MDPASPPEHWHRIYREQPELFDAFCAAEDPEGRIVARLLQLAALAGTTALELGCGTGRTTPQLAARCDMYLATDPSAVLLSLAARSQAPWLVRNRAEALPVKNRSVDRILATWVLAYLRPDIRRRALREASRTLRPGPGAGVWLVENHWEGEFQELRERAGYGGEPGVKALIEEDGFQVVARVESELRFPSAPEAERILGALCGDTVTARLRRAPRSRIGHAVVILFRPLRFGRQEERFDTLDLG